MANVEAIYYNSIGCLNIRLVNLDPKFITNREQIKLLHKCEDGKLIILIKTPHIFYQFSIFISGSLRANLSATKFFILENEINIRYLVNSNLISKESLFTYLESMRIQNCFDIDFSDDNYKYIRRILCRNCNEKLIDSDSIENKIIFNFNYDYIENLEMLSCHESDIENIIPNIEDKLTNIVNITNSSLDINYKGKLLSGNKAYLIEEKTIYCSSCSLMVGIVHNKQKFDLLAFSLPFIRIGFASVENRMDINENGLNIINYFRYILLLSFIENKNIIIIKTIDLTSSIMLLIETPLINLRAKEIIVPNRKTSNELTNFLRFLEIKILNAKEDVYYPHKDNIKRELCVLSGEFNLITAYIEKNMNDNKIILEF